MKKDESKKEIIEKINQEYEEFHKKFLDLQQKQQKLISEYRKRLEEVRMRELKDSVSKKF
jgi:hypothetical protein